MMHIRHLFILLLLSLYSSNPSFAVDKQQQDSALYYIVHEPGVKIAHPHVLFLLHGYGGSEQNLYNLALTHLPKDLLIVSVRGPITISDGSYAWCHVNVINGERMMNAEEAEESRKSVLLLIDQIAAKYHTDPEHVYLMGFSQGARMSYAVALTHPEKIKGVAILSGSLSEDVKPKTANEKKLQHTSWFISHGSKDVVIPIGKSYMSRDFLKQKGINPEYHEYQMGHEIKPLTIEDLKKWLVTLDAK